MTNPKKRVIQTLWIYSGRNQWFTNGVQTITVEVSHRAPFRIIASWYYALTNKVIHREDLEIGSHRDVVRRLAPPWKPRSLEEIIRILDSSNDT